MFCFIHHDISLVPVCKEHLEALSRSMREEDRAELWASHRLCPLEALTRCVQESAYSFALLYKGEPVSIFGISPEHLLGVRACVWQLTSQKLPLIQKSFYRLSKAVLLHFKSLYPRLYCAPDVRYRQALRYVRRLGFQPVGEAVALKGPETKFQYHQIT